MCLCACVNVCMVVCIRVLVKTNTYTHMDETFVYSPPQNNLTMSTSVHVHIISFIPVDLFTGILGYTRETI